MPSNLPILVKPSISFLQFYLVAILIKPNAHEGSTPETTLEPLSELTAAPTPVPCLGSEGGLP